MSFYCFWMPCERNTAELTLFIKFMIGQEGIFVASPKYPPFLLLSLLLVTANVIWQRPEHTCCFPISSLAVSFKKKSTRLRFSRTPLLNSTYLYRLNLSQWEFRSVLNLLKFLPCIYNYSFMGLLKIIAVYNILCIYARHSFTFPGR